MTSMNLSALPQFERPCGVLVYCFGRMFLIPREANSLAREGVAVDFLISLNVSNA